MTERLKFSVLNSTEINKNPLNTSPTKQQYSFAKNPRFKDPRPEYKCPQYTYNLPDQKSKRSTTYGYGSKVDFTKNAIVSPGPFQYNKKSDFDKDASTKKGKTFGLSRAEMFEYGHITSGPIKNPGPGNYTLNRNLSQTSYTMRSKTNSSHNPVFLTGGKRSYLGVPGPGQYEQEQGIKKDGKHFYSKYRSSGATTINPAHSQRFPNEKPYAPGPNHYSTIDQGGIQGNSRYTLSNHRSNGTRAFTHDKKENFAINNANGFKYVPGPGSYRLPSEFGNYDHYDMYKTQPNLKTQAN